MTLIFCIIISVGATFILNKAIRPHGFLAHWGEKLAVSSVSWKHPDVIKEINTITPYPKKAEGKEQPNPNNTVLARRVQYFEAALNMSASPFLILGVCTCCFVFWFSAVFSFLVFGPAQIELVAVAVCSSFLITKLFNHV